MKVTNSEITSFSDSEEDGDLGVEENSKEYRNKKAEGDLGGAGEEKHIHLKGPNLEEDCIWRILFSYSLRQSTLNFGASSNRTRLGDKVM